MLTTYKATIHGSHIRWTDERPLIVTREQEIEVLITVLYEMSQPAEMTEQRGEQMARCLEKIAQTGGITGIADPVAWQRELRQDRRLIAAENEDVD